LKKLAESRGAQFSFNTLVHRLLVTDNKISGVQLDNGENLQADIVVFNGDPRALAMGKLGPEFTQVATESKTDERSLSARVWSFASQVQGLDLVHHNVFFAKNPIEEFDAIKAGRMPTDPTIYVCAQDRGLNAAYPKNERFEIILNAAPLTTAEPLEKEFEKCQTITLKTLDQFGLKFSLAPSKSSLTTPHHFANLFPASEGSLYGQSPHGMIAAFRRPKSKTVIPGLYLAGGGAHPGAGIPMATLSARHAVEEILNDQISTSQFHQTGTHGGISMA
jgi:1-hydroxycarotenoid 3,4-desaturase